MPVVTNNSIFASTGGALPARISGPAAGGQPLWGLNDRGASSSNASLFATDPWDTFVLGGRQLPGMCELIPGGVSAVQLNVKKDVGSNNTRITYTGYLAKKFSVICEICTVDQWAELQNIIDIFWPAPNKVSTLSQLAVSVGHPNLSALKIHSAVLEGVSLLTPGRSGEGFKMMTFLFQENPPRSPKLKSVIKSAGPPAEDDAHGPNSHQRGATPPKAQPPSSNPANASVSGAPVSE